MPDYSFDISSEDSNAIQRQLNIIQRLISQRDQIMQSLAHEVEFANSIFRAAAAEARPENESLNDVEIPMLIHPSGKMMANIQNNKVSWSTPDMGPQAETP